MSAETWYSAQEAVDAGLADRLDEDAEPEPVSNRFNLAVFNYAGRAHAPAPRTPAAVRGGSRPTTQERSPAVAFSDEQLTNLRQRVGVPEGADEATILAALDEALAERAEPQTNQTLPPGTVAIDAEQLSRLQAAAQAGVDAREQQQAETRERLVDAAVADGRIPPARREHWLAQLAADAGAAGVLESLAPGLVPVAAIGSDGAPPADTVDALYESVFGPEV